MQKINTFIVSATANNIAQMTPTEIKMLAEMLVDSKNSPRLIDTLQFLIQDKLISEIEVQDPVC